MGSAPSSHTASHSGGTKPFRGVMTDPVTKWGTIGNDLNACFDQWVLKKERPGFVAFPGAIPPPPLKVGHTKSWLDSTALANVLKDQQIGDAKTRDKLIPALWPRIYDAGRYSVKAQGSEAPAASVHWLEFFAQLQRMQLIWSHSNAHLKKVVKVPKGDSEVILSSAKDLLEWLRDQACRLYDPLDDPDLELLPLATGGQQCPQAAVVSPEVSSSSSSSSGISSNSNSNSNSSNGSSRSDNAEEGYTTPPPEEAEGERGGDAAAVSREKFEPAVLDTGGDGGDEREEGEAGSTLDDQFATPTCSNFGHEGPGSLVLNTGRNRAVPKLDLGTGRAGQAQGQGSGSQRRVPPWKSSGFTSNLGSFGIGSFTSSPRPATVDNAFKFGLDSSNSSGGGCWPGHQGGLSRPVVATPSQRTQNKQLLEKTYDVVVVGSTLSGLVCAKQLQAQGASVLVLESSSVVGGEQMGSVRFSRDNVVSRGPLLVQGGDDNPITQFCREHSIELHELPADVMQSCAVFDVEDNMASQEAKDQLNNLADILQEKMYLNCQEDQRKGAACGSVQECLHKAIKKLDLPLVNQCELTHAQIRALEWEAASACALQHGAHSTEVSGECYTSQPKSRFAGPSFHVVGGWRPVIDKLSEGLEITTNSPVRHIVCEEGGGVLVGTSSVQVQCQKCVLAVPLRALKKRNIMVTPGLPRWKSQAIDAMGVGSALYTYLTFEEEDVVWDREQLMFGSVSSRFFPLVLNVQKFRGGRGPPCLAFVCSGSVATEVRSMGRAEVVKHCTHVMSFIFHMHGRHPQPTSFVQNARGMSYLPPGVSPNTPYFISSPLFGSLLFAGEGSCDETWGTPEGEWLSGLREAMRLRPQVEGQRACDGSSSSKPADSSSSSKPADSNKQGQAGQGRQELLPEEEQQRPATACSNSIRIVSGKAQLLDRVERLSQYLNTTLAANEHFASHFASSFEAADSAGKGYLMQRDFTHCLLHNILHEQARPQLAHAAAGDETAGGGKRKASPRKEVKEGSSSKVVVKRK